MFIAHLPAGYITAKLLFPRLTTPFASYQAFLFCSVVGAIFPDIDMFYFYLIDHKQHHHHSYVTHFPIVWGALLLLSCGWFYWASKRKNALLAVIFCLSAFIHLFLDTIVGDIWWFAPFIDKSFALATVSARYQPWWLNFLLHWSFGLEILIILWAVYLGAKSKHEI